MALVLSEHREDAAPPSPLRPALSVSIPSPSASPSVGWGVLSRVSGCLTCQLVSCDALGSSVRLAQPHLPDKWQKRGAWGMNEEAPLPHPASAPSPTSAPLDRAPDGVTCLLSRGPLSQHTLQQVHFLVTFI